MKIETMEPKTDTSEMNPSKVASEAEWLIARKDLLTREKELTRLRDEVSRIGANCHGLKLINSTFSMDLMEGKHWPICLKVAVN